MNREANETAVLRAYHSRRGNNHMQVNIVQAALATSAAPTFFEPVYIDGRSYIDGGLGSNNPAFEVQNEAQDIWRNQSTGLMPMVGCMVSIGTGKPAFNQLGRGYRGLYKTIMGKATETEGTAERGARMHADDPYFRFSVEQGLQDVKLDDHRKVRRILGVTDRYLEHQAQQKDLEACAQALSTKRCEFASLPISFRVLRSVVWREKLSHALAVVPDPTPINFGEEIMVGRHLRGMLDSSELPT